MKTRIYIIIILFSSVSMFSCEEYLAEENYSGITGESLVTTEQGMEAMVNACYSCLRLWYGKEYGVLLSEVGTDIYTGGNAYISSEFTTYGPSLNGMSLQLTNYWKYFYLALNTTNSTIEWLPQSVLSDEKKAIREGEVRFIRALFLWHITEIWGEAPLTTEVVRSKQLTATKSSVEDFYKQIFEDLNIAETNLAEVDNMDNPEDYGRINIWTVRAMLARMHLYRKNYDKAFEYANMFIESQGTFELAPSAAYLWDVNNDTYDKNKEIIWSVVYSPEEEPLSYAILRPGASGSDALENWPDRVGNGLHLTFLCYYQKYKPNYLIRDLTYGRAWVRFMPTLYLLDLYNEDVDARFYTYFRNVYLCNNVPENTAEEDMEFTIGDTVLMFSKDVVPQDVKDSKSYEIFDRDVMFNLETEQHDFDRDYYFSLNKFLDPNRTDKESVISGRDVFVFRLSEMYFVAAEAKMYTDGAATAYPYLKAIADVRAVSGDGETMLEKYGVTSDGNGIDIDFILDEKGREFCGEYIRWFDLKRTGKLVERVSAHNPDAYGIQDFHTVRPIPQSQIDAVTNKNEFTQNDGYN